MEEVQEAVRVTANITVNSLFVPRGMKMNKHLIASVIVMVFIMSISLASATWWNNDFAYKQLVTINNIGTGNVNASVYLDVPINVHMNANGNDLRFTNFAENTELDHYIHMVNATSIGVFVWLPSAQNIYMYYGNSTIASNSNPNITVTNAHGETLGSSAPGEPNQWGVTINPSVNVSIIKVGAYAGFNGANAQIFNTTGILQYSGLNALVATFNVTRYNFLIAGTDYGYSMGTLGGTYTQIYGGVSGYPYAGQVNMVQEAKTSQANDVFDLNQGTTNMRNVKNITSVKVINNVYNYTFGGDEIISVGLNKPIDGYNTTSSLVNFNVTLIPQNINITNATIYVWEETWFDIPYNYNLMKFNNTIVFASPGRSTAIDQLWNYSFPKYTNYTWMVTARGTDNNQYNSTFFNFSRVGFTIYNQVFNATTLETKKESYTLNTSIDTVQYPSVTANLIYNGTSYATTNNNGIFSAIVYSPTLYTYTNETKNLYWSVNLNSTTQVNTTPVTQKVNQLLLSPCDNTNVNNNTFINISFKDETDFSPLNATISLSSWVYYLDDLVANKTFTFLNVTKNLNYAFCGTPANSTIKAAAIIQYASPDGATYPQRLTSLAGTYTNVTTQETLYLLSSTAGIYSSYSIVNTLGVTIPGAHVVVTRVINGNTVTVGDAYTDSAGSVTFWLNPNFDHTFTVTKSGYQSITTNIRPTQSLYTITLGSSTTSNNFYYTNLLEGLYWSKSPASGILAPGLYNFTFSLNTSKANIQGCSFELDYQNGTQISSATGCSVDGGILVIALNTTGKGNLNGKYYVTINGTTITLEADARWVEINMGNFSSGGFFTGLKSAFQDITKWPEWGTNPQTADFSRIVFFFLLFSIVLAILNFYLSYDTAYPGAIIYVVTAIVFVLSAVGGVTGPGYFYLEGATNSTYLGTTFASIINNWLIAFHMVLLSIIYYFTTLKRYQ